MVFVVTGPTGNVGLELTTKLVALGAEAPPFRIAAHHPGRITDLFGSEVAVRHLDYDDPTTFAEAFSGGDTVFLLFPLPQPKTVRTRMKPVIDGAVAAGVRHVIYLSVPGGDRSRAIPHGAVEHHLRDTGLGLTVVRPAYFMQNLVRTISSHGIDIVEHDEVFVPAGNGLTSFLDSRDLADIIIDIAREPAAHDGGDYTIPGPEDLSFADVAAILTDVLGRPIAYNSPSRVQFWRRLRKRGHPRDAVAFMEIVYTLARRGWNAQEGSDLRRLLGREPTSFRQFAEDYKWRWETRTWT